MDDRTPVKGHCRCGAELTFQLGPLGYKTVCAACGAVVRLDESQASGQSPRGRRRPKRAPTLLLTCSCGCCFSVRARRAGRHATCPQCQSRKRVPAPNDAASAPGFEAVPLAATQILRTPDADPEPPAPAPGQGVCFAPLPSQPEAAPADRAPDQASTPASKAQTAADSLLDRSDFEQMLASALQDESRRLVLCPACKSEIDAAESVCPLCKRRLR